MVLSHAWSHISLNNVSIISVFRLPITLADIEAFGPSLTFSSLLDPNALKSASVLNSNHTISRTTSHNARKRTLALARSGPKLKKGAAGARSPKPEIKLRGATLNRSGAAPASDRDDSAVNVDGEPHELEVSAYVQSVNTYIAYLRSCSCLPILLLQVQIS
jgi:hypothetical protein